MRQATPVVGRASALRLGACLRAILPPNPRKVCHLGSFSLKPARLPMYVVECEWAHARSPRQPLLGEVWIPYPSKTLRQSTHDVNHSAKLLISSHWENGGSLSLVQEASLKSGSCIGVRMALCKCKPSCQSHTHAHSRPWESTPHCCSLVKNLLYLSQVPTAMPWCAASQWIVIVQRICWLLQIRH